MKRSKGFTLIELLAVIVILGILIGITTVSVNGIRKKQEAENRRNAFSSILTGAKAYVAEHPEKLNNFNNGKVDIYITDIINNDYADIDENKYKELIWFGGDKSQKRYLEVRKCADGVRLYYQFSDLATDRANLNWAKNKSQINYNDCGCEQQASSDTASSNICIGWNSGTNTGNEETIY